MKKTKKQTRAQVTPFLTLTTMYQNNAVSTSSPFLSFFPEESDIFHFPSSSTQRVDGALFHSLLVIVLFLEVGDMSVKPSGYQESKALVSHYLNYYSNH